MATLPTQSRRVVLANAGWLGFNHLATIGLRLCYVYAAARLLDAGAYGLLAYSQSWYVAVMPIALLGVSVLFGRAIGADRARGLAFASATAGPRLAVAAAAMAAVCAMAALVEPIPGNLLLIVIFALTLVPRTMAVGSQAVLTGLERSEQTCANNLVWRAAELAAAVAALAAGAGVLTLAAIHAGSWMLQALDGRFRVRRVAYAAPAAPAGGAARSTLFRDGLPIALAGFITGLSSSGILILFRMIHGPGDQLGSLALLLQVVGLLLGLAVALGNAATPHLTRAVHRGAGGGGRPLHALLSAGSLVATVGAAGLIAAGGPWVAALLGAGFAAIDGWLPSLPLFAASLIWHSLASRMLAVRSGARALLPIAAAGAAATFAVALVTIDRLAGAGAVAAALSGCAVQAMLVLLAVAGARARERRAVCLHAMAFLGACALAAGAMTETLEELTSVAGLALLSLMLVARPVYGIIRARLSG